MSSLPIINDSADRMIREFKRTGKVATSGFQASWLKNPDGYPGKKWRLVCCAADCPLDESCDHCYIAFLAKNHLAKKRTEFLPQNLTEPLRWSGRKMVWCCPEGDPFHKNLTNQEIYQMFAVMQACPTHRFLVLTKRAPRLGKMLSSPDFFKKVDRAGVELLRDSFKTGCWTGANVLIGVSISKQKYVWRVKVLKNLPKAMTKVVFAAPLIGPIQFDDLSFIDWVVVSGERGSVWCDPRPCAWEWMKSIKDQCVAANVRIHFVKRFDPKWISYMEGRWMEFPDMLEAWYAQR